MKNLKKTISKWGNGTEFWEILYSKGKNNLAHDEILTQSQQDYESRLKNNGSVRRIAKPRESREKKMQGYFTSNWRRVGTDNKEYYNKQKDEID